MSYNSRLREARKNAGLTQTELGNMVGCAKTTITGYETGKSEPSMAMLSNIMHALNVDANFIFQDEVREHHESHATPSEMDSLVKPYRALDEAGQKIGSHCYRTRDGSMQECCSVLASKITLLL
mgnify:CR=1 FL=1